MPYGFKRRNYGSGSGYTRSYSGKRGGKRYAAYTRQPYVGAQRPEMGELKFKDSSRGYKALGVDLDMNDMNMNPNVPAATSLVNSLGQGAADSERIGRNATLVKLEIKGSVVQAAVAGTAAIPGPHQIAIWVVLDNNFNAVMPVTSLPFGPVAPINFDLITEEFLNPNQAQRFKLLKKITFKMNRAIHVGDGAAADAGRVVHPFEFTVPLHNMVVTYKGATELLAEMTSGAILILGSSSSGAEVPPQITYQSRLWFRG